MSDKVGEQLSAWIDGELSAEELELFYKRIGEDGELRRRWQSYHQIGDAISGHGTSIQDDQLADRIASVLVDEPAPTMQRRNSLTSRFIKPLAGFAVAASVATVAVLALQFNAQVSIDGDSELVAEKPAEPVEYRRLAGLEEYGPRPNLQRELDRYLVVHSEQLSGRSIQGMSPIRRIAVERAMVE